MGRVLRWVPEILFILKGLVAAFRSVFFTLIMIVKFAYIFAIVFKQLTAKSELEASYFSSVLCSMQFLMIHGTLLMNTDYKLMEIGADKDGMQLNMIFILFILITAVLFMNMLIGVLCDMVTIVAATEKEQLILGFTKKKLTEMLKTVDVDANRLMSKEEFWDVVSHPDAPDALADVGVDIIGLVDFADFLFASEVDGTDIELTQEEFIEVVLSLRGSNTATVRDIIDLRKCLLAIQSEIRGSFEDLERLFVSSRNRKGA